MRSAKREDAESSEEISLPASLSSDAKDEWESGAEHEGGGPDRIQPEVEGWDGGTSKPAGGGRLAEAAYGCGAVPGAALGSTADVEPACSINRALTP